MKDYVKCLICGSCIDVNTENELIWCACGAIAVDGNEIYTRIIGKEENLEIHTSSEEEEDEN